MAIIDKAPRTPDLNPRGATIDLAGPDLKQLAKLKLGMPVSVTLRGTIKEMAQVKGDGDDRKSHGSLRLELTKLTVGEVDGSAIDELLDEGE